MLGHQISPKGGGTSGGESAMIPGDSKWQWCKFYLFSFL